MSEQAGNGAAVQPVMGIQVVLLPDGSVELAGNVGDPRNPLSEIQAVGLLEKGIDRLKEWHRQGRASGGIVVASGAIPDVLKGRMAGM